MEEKLPQNSTLITKKLNSLAPTEAPSALQELTRFKSNLKGQARPQTPSVGERINLMLKKYQPALVALAFVAVFAAAFSFAPVRALAGDFLKIFRVQEVKIIPVNMSDIESMENRDELEALLQQLDPSASLTSGGGEPQTVASLDEAAPLLNFSPVQITALPADLGAPDKISVDPAATANLQLDKELLDAIFEAAEIEVDIPESINNTPIVIHKPPMLMQMWGDEDLPTLGFAQLTTPEVEYPDDLDLNALGVAGLQLVGMSEAEARAIGATIDWANTLVLPIPSDMDASYREVTINGGQGFLFEEPAGKITVDGQTHKAPTAGVMWQNNGMTYLLQGDFSGEELLRIAESVQ